MRAERRRFPRAVLQADCELSWVSKGEICSGKGSTVNLSQNGLQLRCEASTAETLIGQEVSPAECQIAITLPRPWPVVQMSARLVFSRRLSIEAYQLGLEFTELKGAVTADLEAFLAARANRV